MIKVIDFEEQISTLLPVTHALLKSANLTVHNNVTRITLHGSRGLAGCYRSDSDLDLSLIEIDNGRVQVDRSLTPWKATLDLTIMAATILLCPFVFPFK